MGVGASMLWWDESFCRLLAEGGLYVIRYDHRDTGRSVTYPPGQPGYTSSDLVADATAVLDAYRLPAAHVVGVSAGGALAQLLALEFPDRVLSLVLISTSPALPTQRSLPPPTEEFTRFVRTKQIDRTNAVSTIEYLVAYSRMLAGGERTFDEAALRELVRRELERAHDFAAAQNHELLAEGEQPRRSLSAIEVPTLVIHGSADPMFPIEHGRALADAIPNAQLRTLDHAGHGIDPTDRETIAHAILEHSA
jgi:pimeloyl-ACP methyl ester carboxylesterase